MIINAHTQMYGVLGNPVRHSLSPLIHNAVFQSLKINAVYLAFEVDTNSLGLAFEAIRSMGMKGANITIPFKEEALHFVDEVPEDLDRCIGAINTVVHRDGKLLGYNTDAPGFLTAVGEELDFKPRGKKILVLGAGGAARGVVAALARAGAEKIWIFNRTQARAEGLSQYLAGYFPEIEIEPLDLFGALDGEKIDLVVNATSSGMKADDAPPLDFKFIHKKAKVYDLVYNPSETAFLKTARELGHPAAGGLGMLAAQAALSFELWTGQKAGVREKMLETLKACF